MARITPEQVGVDFAQILRREMDLYTGSAGKVSLLPVFDDRQSRYAVIGTNHTDVEMPAWVVLMARVVGDFVIIDCDITLEKPLVDALMTNGGIPREKIVLAYAGETLPTSTK